MLAKVLCISSYIHHDGDRYFLKGETVKLTNLRKWYIGSDPVYLYKCKGMTAYASKNTASPYDAIPGYQCVYVKDVKLIASKFLDIDLIRSLGNSKGFIRTSRG